MNFMPRNIAALSWTVEEAAEHIWREACCAYLAACFGGAPPETILQRAQAMYEARVDLKEAECMALRHCLPLSSCVSVNHQKPRNRD
jgi:hypothetical protein